MRHIAFLRAINIGGHVVKMTDLKKLFEAIQDVVKKNAGTGAFGVPKNCRYTAPK